MADGRMTMRDHAVELGKQGLRVFKLVPGGKLPAIERFYDAATADIEKIRSAWTDPVSGDSLTNNIGIATGGGLLVLDVDRKNGKQGFESLEALRDLGLDTETRMAATPSGGLHLYYGTGAQETRNTANKIGDGLDTRGFHGFVVAPGSEIEPGHPYVWMQDIPIKPAPDWLIRMCEASRAPGVTNTTPLTEFDSDAAIQRAIRWLVDTAPEAVEGAGGNQTTYQVAARLKDFGISVDMARTLMIEHWNETKAIPPWPMDELERIVENAYRYGSSPPGIRSPEADFTPVEEQQPAAAWPAPAPLLPFDAAQLPPRRWVVPGVLVRNFVSGLVSPGGTGKTQLIAALALAVAAGDEKLIGMPIAERTKVWYWNQEDDADELKRRFAAVMQHFGTAWDDIEGRIYVDSGVEKPLLLVKRTADGRLKESADIETVIRRIKAEQIGVFVIDPLVEFHEAEENDNVQMRFVMAAARKIAVEAECAVMVVAHTRKPPGAGADGFAGDADSLRGAGAQGNVMRIVHTLYGMTIKDAKRWGIRETERHLYVRMDSAKSNLSLTDGKPRWFRRTSITLGGVNGEPVGVLDPAALVERTSEVDMLHLAAKAIDASLDRKHWYGVREVIDGMPPEEQGLFDLDNRHHSKPFTATLKREGHELGSEGRAAVATDYGTLHVAVRRGRTGMQLMLDEDAPAAPEFEDGAADA